MLNKFNSKIFTISYFNNVVKSLLVISFLVVSGCSNRFVIKKEHLKEDYTEIIDYINKNDTLFNTYSIKYVGKFESPDFNLRFRGFLRIIKNERIWISISPMGVEAARILFTPKEIKFMNRQNNTFFISDYAYFNEKYNIDIGYKTIEQILTNRFIIDNTENKVVNRTESGLYNLEYTDENKNMTTYQIHPALKKLTSMIFTDFSQNAKLKVHFSDYIDVENQKLPEHINIELEKEGKFHNVELNYKKIIVNSSIKLPFRIPNKFERVWP